MFEKKVDFYKKKDRDTWLQIRKALAEEGIRHVSAGHYFGDSLAPNGIGGYLDPRNYGANGKIDRRKSKKRWAIGPPQVQIGPDGTA